MARHTAAPNPNPNPPHDTPPHMAARNNIREAAQYYERERRRECWETENFPAGKWVNKGKKKSQQNSSRGAHGRGDG